MNKYMTYAHTPTDKGPGELVPVGLKWADIAQDLEDMAAAFDDGANFYGYLSLANATPFTSALIPLYALARLHRERGR